MVFVHFPSSLSFKNCALFRSSVVTQVLRTWGTAELAWAFFWAASILARISGDMLALILSICAFCSGGTAGAPWDWLVVVVSHSPGLMLKLSPAATAVMENRTSKRNFDRWFF